MIAIHPSARVSALADIEDSVRGTRIEISENVMIDAFVKIKPVGGTGDLFIGAGTVINSGCVLYTGNGVRIGRSVAVAANCTFAPVNHEYSRKDMPITKQGFRPSKGGIDIGDDVWLGANCVILDGARIGDGCVVAAGSIVRGVLEAYAIYGGNPLARLGERK
jgi:acetyltransferase-like isoleucine patch superfamily enzyme